MCSDYITESQRFQIQLRKTSFLNLYENNHHFKSLGEDNKLSDEMKSLSILACA